MSSLVYQINIEVENSTRAHDCGFDISAKSWERWCNLNGCDFLVLSMDATDPPHWYKYRIFDILRDRNQSYERLAFVDADTIVHPGCPNFFERAGSDFGVVKNFGCLDWIIRGIENYGDALFSDYGYLPYSRYFNTGFLVFNPEFESFFDTINKFYVDNKAKIQETISTFKGGQDQTIVNYLAAFHEIPIRYLPCTFNMQDLEKRMAFVGDGLWYTDYGHIFHYNAGQSMRNIMSETYNKLWQ